jgi:hypothetical protein
MSEAGVIPPPEERHRAIVTPMAILTDWHIEGEVQCPDCGTHFAVDAALDDLVKFTAVHECPP